MAIKPLNLWGRVFRGDFKRFLASGSADIFADALARTSINQFTQINDTIITKARYGKVYQGGTTRFSRCVK
jgi:hypothetical protein